MARAEKSLIAAERRRQAGRRDKTTHSCNMSAVRNVVNLSGVGKGYAARTVLRDVTAGVADGERIGVVGGNGQGKSTLLRLVAGLEEADAGAVTRTAGVTVGLLAQADELDSFTDVRAALVGERAEHEWAGDRAFREVLAGLLGGVSLDRFTQGLDTPVQALSGGERRRVALARLLLHRPDLLLLDEPTNHLDIEAIAWLADHLAARRGAMLVVTHDRWFLDAVSAATWEVADGDVHRYEGGYAAYVLARAERDRLEASRADKRRQLVRKELAWLRRGPPARTSKPKFRIEAASALIADEPPARDMTELLRFASSRLGDRVLEAEEVSFAFDGGASLLQDVTWRLGPGDRAALVGANGSGKTTLLRLLAGDLAPGDGSIERGQTVRLAYLHQEPAEVDGGDPTVIESLERIRLRARLSGGEEITAGKLAERFGFRGDRARTPVSRLSGGERRRLGLMRLLMAEPNVLLLDEPTNDLDIDTLTALEDLLDGWPGTLVVVSHDRYFVERVCDNVFALGAGAGIRHLPGGIDQYLDEQRADAAAATAAPPRLPGGATRTGAAPRTPGARLRAARKEVQRLERELDRQAERERALHEAIAAHGTDHVRLSELTAELDAAVAERERLEAAWLERPRRSRRSSHGDGRGAARSRREARVRCRACTFLPRASRSPTPSRSTTSSSSSTSAPPCSRSASSSRIRSSARTSAAPAICGTWRGGSACATRSGRR
jgi:ATP-binding cassette subfamily F protein uup